MRVEFNIELDEILDSLRDLHAKVDVLQSNQLEIADMANQDMDDLEREVGENNDVIGSAVTLINGIREQLAAAGTDPAKLRELSARLDSQSRTLAEAVAAGTPADPGTSVATTDGGNAPA